MGLGDFEEKQVGPEENSLESGWGAEIWGKDRFRILRDRSIVSSPVGSVKQNPGDAGVRLGFPVTLAVSQAGL